MKCFEISSGENDELDGWLTVNMKCFEIGLLPEINHEDRINRKHEMFWNSTQSIFILASNFINRKHEMFWNSFAYYLLLLWILLTVNMKCFEIN